MSYHQLVDVKALAGKVKALLTALPTVLAFVVLAAPVIAEEAAKVLPSPFADRVNAIALTVAAVAGAVLAVIRRLEAADA